jgi:glycosyltransferase involved in cell wall biosynthesis
MKTSFQKLSKMKYGIYLESNFTYSDGNLSCQDVYSKFLDLLSKDLSIKFDYLIKVAPPTTKKYNKIESYNNVFIIKSYKNLPSLIPFYVFYLPFVRKEIHRFIDQLDCIIIMIPSPIAKTIFQIARKREKKIILIVRQDIVELVKFRFKGVKIFLAGFIAKYYQNFFYYNLNNKTSVLTSGEKIRQLFLPYTNKVYSIADSRFVDKEIRSLLDIKEVNFNEKLKILFVGRLELTKGIRELLGVAHFLKDRIQLTIVGDGPMRDEISNFIFNNHLEDTILCSGFIEFGDELLQKYKENDLRIG